MLLTVYVDAHTTKFYVCKLFLVVSFFWNPETFEKIPMEWLILCKTVSNKRHIRIWDAVWLAAFSFSCQLATIKPLTCGLSQQPDWACFWLIASAGLSENCSWSTQNRLPNSAGSRTLESLWGIFCHQWAACREYANLALVVPGRLLLAGVHRIGHSPKKKFSLVVVTPQYDRVWIQSVPGRTALPMLLGLKCLRKKNDMWIWIIEIMI